MEHRDPNLVTSGLSGPITAFGVTLQVEIYRLEHEPEWALEVVLDDGTSIVWDELFGTDTAAYAALQHTLDTEGVEAITQPGNVIPFRQK